MHRPNSNFLVQIPDKDNGSREIFKTNSFLFLFPCEESTVHWRFRFYHHCPLLPLFSYIYPHMWGKYATFYAIFASSIKVDI